MHHANQHTPYLSNLFSENREEILGKVPLKRIAILRALPGLGDFLCTVPALRSLRAAFPQAEIVLIGVPSVKLLVERFKHYLDELVEFPGYPGLPEVPVQPPEIPAFLQVVQQQRFDLAIQMHGSGVITNPLTVLLGAKYSTGFFMPGYYCPDEIRFLPYLPYESEVRRYLRLLEFLGIPSQGKELEFPLWPEDKEALLTIDEVRQLTPGSYACIHPGASTPTRRWSPEGFAAVADALAARGFTIVITGTAKEAELTAKVASLMESPSLNLAGRTNLGALAVLLKNARLLICNDTGVSHLAAALKLPSVIVFTQSDPSRWAPLDSDRHRAIYHTNDTTTATAIAEALDLLEKYTASTR